MNAGVLPSADKYDALAAADVFCNPSVNESFSIVLMEAWLCGTPVLVNHGCKVTREFAFQGRGGLTYRDYVDFEVTLEYLEKRPDVRRNLALEGADFVRRSFAWQPLVQRFGEWMTNLASERREPG